jgi:hypothetical protein
MKTYEVTIIHTAYATMCVDAESAEQAEDLAWKQWDGEADDCAGNEIWNVEELTEQQHQAIQVKRGNVTTKLAYHAKSDAHGWKHIVTTRIDAPEWSDWDRQAYRHMMEQGTTSLVMGWNMWELVQERAQ